MRAVPDKTFVHEEQRVFNPAFYVVIAIAVERIFNDGYALFARNAKRDKAQSDRSALRRRTRIARRGDGNIAIAARHKSYRHAVSGVAADNALFGYYFERHAQTLMLRSDGVSDDVFDKIFARARYGSKRRPQRAARKRFGGLLS